MNLLKFIVVNILFMLFIVIAPLFLPAPLMTVLVFYACASILTYDLVVGFKLVRESERNANAHNREREAG